LKTKKQIRFLYRNIAPANKATRDLLEYACQASQNLEDIGLTLRNLQIDLTKDLLSVLTDQDHYIFAKFGETFAPPAPL
jgi:hypothetical protein